MKTFQIIQTQEEPKDCLEGNFASLYYYTKPKEQGYESICISTDEAYNFSDVAAIKESLAKEARAYAVAHNIIGEQVPLNADELSISRLGHIKLILLYKTLEAMTQNNKTLRGIFDSVFNQTTHFKCADNEIRELSGKDIAKAHEEAMLSMSSIWFGVVPEIKEVVQTNAENTENAQSEGQ